MGKDELYVNVGGAHVRPGGQVIRQGDVLIPTEGERKAFPEKFKTLEEARQSPKMRRLIGKSLQKFKWPAGNGVEWGSITWRAKRSIILCQGPSFGVLDLDLVRWAQRVHRVRVIAVNGAIDYFPESDFWFTLDPSLENQSRMNSPIEGCRYVAAVPETYATAQAGLLHYRRPAPEHVTYLRRVEGEGLCRDRGAIHSGNSGWGAFQLARHLRSERTVLSGLDGRGLDRWDGTKNRRLNYLADIFAQVGPLGGWWVVNASPGSAIRRFPILPPDEAIRLLCA